MGMQLFVEGYSLLGILTRAPNLQDKVTKNQEPRTKNAREASMNLFAYGTLMWPEVLAAVMGRRLAGEEATLAGYERLRVVGQHYPVIVPMTDSDVEGVLYRDLTDQEFDAVDAFEGEEYNRVEVRVGDTTAQVYVLNELFRHIAASEPWHPEQLTPEHLAAFCGEYTGWDQL
jgi:gamma-glutamylcyclotransferase (GGCT)/AIG2-like uncharacterized protein YtfP